MKVRDVLVAAGLVIGVGWLWRTTAKGILLQGVRAQLDSIWSVFVDAWVLRAGNWLVYTKDGAFQEFSSIQTGETVWLQVTAPAVLTFGNIHQNLIPDGNINAVVWQP